MDCRTCAMALGPIFAAHPAFLVICVRRTTVSVISISLITDGNSATFDTADFTLANFLISDFFCHRSRLTGVFGYSHNQPIYFVSVNCARACSKSSLATNTIGPVQPIRYGQKCWLSTAPGMHLQSLGCRYRQSLHL